MSGPTPRDGLNLIRSQACAKLPVPTASFAEQTVIVTGGNTGLGREAAMHIARLGAAKVILGVRTVSKGEKARAYIEEATGRTGVVEVWALDLCDFGSIQAFAERASGLARLDAVILNAGTWPISYETAEGHETTITVNVISTFLLYHQLAPTLQRSAGAHGVAGRATVVDSALHKMARLKARQGESVFGALAEPLKAADYDMRYNDSKLLVMLYGRALAAAAPLAPHRPAVLLNLVNPGWCESGLHRNGLAFGQRLFTPIQRSTDEGARTLVDAITPVASLDEARGRHGVYMDDCQVKQPSAWLDSEDGRITERRVWTELNDILEAIKPGVTGVLSRN